MLSLDGGFLWSLLGAASKPGTSWAFPASSPCRRCVYGWISAPRSPELRHGAHAPSLALLLGQKGCQSLLSWNLPFGGPQPSVFHGWVQRGSPESC